MKTSTVEMSSDESIILQKMFGPMIFADIRITVDVTRKEWVIERLSNDNWTVFCTIPAQLEKDFEN